MVTAMHIKARLTPWDDPAFVKAYEQARDEVHEAHGHPDGVKAGAIVEQRLHEAGFPKARVAVIQTVNEKLQHTSHWLVSRDG